MRFRVRFLCVCVSLVSSCTNAAVVATPQPTAIQHQHHNNNSSRYITKYSSSASVPTRVRQRKQARMKEQVKCCREPAMYEYFFYVSLFPHSSLFRLRLYHMHTRRFAPRASHAARCACSGRKNSVKRKKKSPSLILSANWRLILDFKCKLAT